MLTLTPISLKFKLLLILVCAAAACATAALGQNAPPYPAPKHLGDPEQLGRGIQRTMTLLATSTPQRRNTVRILFYGQSITEQNWWHDVADDIKRRYPNADLVIENRALGGFSSQLLVKTAETDLYSFYPDLMIFHVYGAHTQYEDIMRRTRQRTTAEVLIQTDHVTRDEDLNEETDPARLKPDGKIWNSFMNYLHLPAVARKYGCALLDQRNLWKQYLRDYNVHAAQLLKDGVHQNEYGNYLMSEIVKAYLTPRSDTQIDPMNCDTVKTYAVGKGAPWQAGKLTLPFDGNRVDVVVRDTSVSPAEVRIDGRRPSQIPELYGFTRALSTPGGKWPVILKMSANRPLFCEDWSMQVTSDPADPKLFRFTVHGSRTGEDGEGRSDQRFVSRSGRIVIEPEDWNVDYSLALPGIKPVPAKFTVNWQVVPRFQDRVVAPAATPGRERLVTVAQGLTPGRHVLEITGPRQSPVQAVRIYRPPVAGGENDMPSLGQSAGAGAVKHGTIHILPLGDSITQGGREGRPEYTYRYPLYYMLHDAGYRTDYVGSLQAGLNAGFQWPDRKGTSFDAHHEGHYGWKTAQVRDHLAEWMQSWKSPPDIALIHLGTNDQSAEDFDAAIVRPMEQIVAMLRLKNPHVAVLIGHLNFNGGAALKIRPLIDALAKRLNTPDSPVITVAHYAGWHEKPDEPGSDTFDWAHPNEQGQEKMARHWLEAMKPYLDRLQ